MTPWIDSIPFVVNDPIRRESFMKKTHHSQLSTIRLRRQALTAALPFCVIAQSSTFLNSSFRRAIDAIWSS